MNTIRAYRNGDVCLHRVVTSLSYLEDLSDGPRTIWPEAVMTHHDDGVSDVTTEVRHGHDPQPLAHL